MPSRTTKTRTATTARRARASLRIRQDILQAAAAALAEEPHATIHDIAREAGYSTASLYSYFPSKQAIVAALFEQLRSDFLATFDVVDPEGLTFVQRLELLLQRQLELADRHRDAFRVFLSLQPEAMSARTRATELSGHEMLVARFADWLQEAAPPAALSRHPRQRIARLLLSVSGAFFMEWIRGGTGDKLAKNARVIVDVFLHGITGGAGEEPPVKGRR